MGARGQGDTSLGETFNAADVAERRPYPMQIVMGRACAPLPSDYSPCHLANVPTCPLNQLHMLASHGELGNLGMCLLFLPSLLERMSISWIETPERFMKKHPRRLVQT